ncbi:MAG TPA: hypothetical protein G4N96_13815 [Chloroflexi bacterium]|nr:hypothetical protein [Chloroflexota bacterium]
MQHSRNEGLVFAPRESGFAKPGASPIGLIFIDGSSLRFQEYVIIQADGAVLRPLYSYHYQRPDGYYFRYDKLRRPFESPVKRIPEPQRHLQVTRPSPRFPTHSTHLAELLDLIKYNFYT